METKFAEPFTNIAISLSGGGYRATTFHLGALSYLNSLEYQGENMLNRVKVLSTISGGTLTGVMYALYCAKGRSFEACYQKIFDLLSEDKLVERAFEKLNNTTEWRDKYKSKDLINAFSEVYNEYFYEDETFKVLFENDLSHLTDVIFGSTEFTTGIQFRFTKNDDKGKFGNGNLNLPDTVALNIRLGDTAASSSCFPGGFEPMVMPRDYAQSPDGPISKAWNEKYQTTGIMDGGVIDNQGIEGVQLAESRHVKEDKIPWVGTYIISDVSGQRMVPFDVPKVNFSRFKDFFSLRRINLLVGIFVTAMIAILYFLSPPILGTAIVSGLLTLGILWFVIFFIIKSTFNNALKGTLGKQNQHLFLDISVILKTPVYILIYLIKMRATSVIKMVSDIFLRRIRALQLKQLFSDKDWNYRIKTNNIYTLNNDNSLPAEMKDVINVANGMPTTLWFSDDLKKQKALQKLIACGQFTLCFNLRTYIERSVKGKEDVWNSLDQTTQNDIDTLHKKLDADWELFLKNPLRMV